jgi:hypothetical protein
MDDEQVSNDYPVYGLPTSFFVGPDGKIAAMHIGPLTESSISEYLQRLH